MITTHQKNKSVLAKLLANENLTVRHVQGMSTAMFDVQRRVLLLPVWQKMSEDLYDMLVGHEVGHALFTPPFVDELEAIARAAVGNDSLQSQKLAKSYLNIVEDVRIDKLQKRRYPGLKRNYLKGYKELIDQNFFGSTINLRKKCFADRLNLFFKGGHAIGVKFTRDEMPFVVRAEKLETWAEVVALTIDVYKFSALNEEPLSKDNQFDPMGDDPADIVKPKRVAVVADDKPDAEDDGEDENEQSEEEDFDEVVPSSNEETEDGEGASTPSDEKSEKSDETSSPSDERGDKSDEKSNQSDDTSDDEKDGEQGENAPAPPASPGGRGTPDDGDQKVEDKDLPEAPSTEEAARHGAAKLASTNIYYTYVTRPQVDLKDILVDYKDLMKNWAEKSELIGDSAKDRAAMEVAEFKRQENDAISFMVKEFDMRKAADAYRRTSIAKSGILDTNKLHSYRTSEDLFKKFATVKEGKNHGFVFLLDWSGSMSTYMGATIRQMISQMMFCKRAQIPFEVYAFADTWKGSDGAWKRSALVEDVANGAFDFQRFAYLNLFSSRMSNTEMARQLRDMFYQCGNVGRYSNRFFTALGGTPLNEAIAYLPEVVELFQKRSGAQIVSTIILTDGQGNSTSFSHGNYNEGYYALPDSERYKMQHQYVYADPHTKKEYLLKDVTRSLLQVLKDRTGCNLIGFEIKEGGGKHFIWNTVGYCTKEETKKWSAHWNQEGFLSKTDIGYDEFWYLNTKNLTITKTELQVDKTMSKARLLKAFSASSRKAKTSRIMLRNFIARVATPA